MRILYIARMSAAGDLFLPIASALRRLRPDAENILIDPSHVFHEEPRSGPSPAELFRQNGFEGIMIAPGQFPELADLSPHFKAYSFYLGLLKHYQPSAVVVPHELGAEFYAVQSALILGIPTYHVQHGIWGPMKLDDYYSEESKQDSEPGDRPYASTQWKILKKKCPAVRRLAKHLNAAAQKVTGQDEVRKPPAELLPFGDRLVSADQTYPIHADRMAVYGPYYKRQVIERRPEYGKERVDVVGYLRGCALDNDGSESRDMAYNRYGLDRKDRLALYFYSPFQEFPKRYGIEYHPNDALADAIKAIREVDKHMNILVLLHPNIRYDHYRKELVGLVRKGGFRKVRIDRAHNDHFVLYEMASLVVGVKSSTLFEAMISQTPVVVQAYVLSRIFDPQHIEACAVTPVFSPLHMRRQVRRALKDRGFQERMCENQKMLCSDLFGPLDGRSGERAAMAIAQLVERSEQFARLSKS